VSVAEKSKTQQAVEGLIFRTLTTEPTEDQYATAERVAAAYEAKHGPISKEHAPTFGGRVRTLLLKDVRQQLKVAVRQEVKRIIPS
jgi:hypothetical protein